ncbi:Transcription elongation factor spt6, partial [Coemansia javaensis]
MSDASEAGDGRRRRGRRDEDESDESGSDGFDTGRRRYEDDDDDDEDDEDDEEGEDELRRDGFVVDDDDVEEDEQEASEGEQERRRKRREKKKRRRRLQAKLSDSDAPNDDDMDLLAENRYGGARQAEEPKRAAGRFKRLKRGRRSAAAAADDGDDLQAELDDLLDTGEAAAAAAAADDDDGTRRRGGRGARGGRSDGDRLGLFEGESDGGSDAGGEYSDGGVDDDDAPRGRAAAAAAARAAAGGGGGGSAGRDGGAVGSFLTEGLDAIDDETWMELQDIFGTGEEYAFAMEAPVEAAEKTLADVFEPAELEAKMMTQRDEDIRTTDVPERMQMRVTGADLLRPLSEDEIEEETTWVVRQLHAWLTRREAHSQPGPGPGPGPQGEGEPALFQYADFANERFLAAVLSVLKLLSQDFYEVPYIAQHRREVFVTPIGDADGALGADSGEEAPTREWLSVDDLWRLYDYDLQFRGFLAARRQLQNTVRRLKGDGTGTGSVSVSGEPAQALSVADEAHVAELVATAASVEDIADVTEWLQAQYAAAFRAWAQQRAGFKRVRSAAPWDQALRDGTSALIDQMGITARQIGDNVASPGRHSVGESGDEPLRAAAALVGARFGSADAAVRAATATFAQLVALEPQVRRFVRAYCDEHACVMVRPTDKGLREITHDDHPAMAFKFLRQKPTAAFADSAQFAAIERAAADGLVRIEFSLSGEYRFGGGNDDDDRVFAEDRDRSAQIVAAQLAQLALPEDGSGSGSGSGSSAWAGLRAAALLAAVRDHVLPQVWRETAQRLRQLAFSHIAGACRRALERRINVQAPRTGRMGAGEIPRVAVVAGGGFAPSSRGALRVVLVDEHGTCREELSADSMRADAPGAQVLRDLLGRQTVDVVAVAGMTLQTRRLFDDVRTVVDDHCARTGDDIMLTYASDEAARLWWTSARAHAEQPAMRPEERYCLSVARTLQDPALEYAAMGEDLLHLPLHPRQRDVDQRALLPVVERALVDVINRVGVDVNEAARHPHKRAALQYVSGLGPRKAHAIAARIAAGDRPLESRSDLVVRRLCTRTVFVNCASFLRVRPAAMDVLDDTRVHPEDYDLARKMALDALDIEDEDDDADNADGPSSSRRRREGPSRYVAELMRKSPERLDDLDLVKYAEELKRLLDVHKLETLKFIKHELQHPRDDPRPEFVPPDDAHVLRMLTGEIVGETLADDGRCVVSGTVVRVQPRFAIVRLDSGLEGFLNVANVADHHVEEAQDELAPGQPVVAVVRRIDLEKMSLDLSMRQSDVSAACERALAPDPARVDRYFDVDAEARLRERERDLQQKSTARMRTVPHPLFKPLNGREAEQYLAARPRGDCVIRPSSRGIDHIAITWKVADDLYQHIDVKEEGKPHDGALGTTFVVGSVAYTDLDELIALHIDPIARKLDEVRRFPKFYDPEADPLYVSEPAADVLGANDHSPEYRTRRLELWEARVGRHLDTMARSTGRGAYCVALSLSKPGALVLAFKPKPDYRGIMKWTARVEPNEYKLGDRGRYPSIASLING